MGNGSSNSTRALSSILSKFKGFLLFFFSGTLYTQSSLRIQVFYLFTSSEFIYKSMRDFL